VTFFGKVLATAAGIATYELVVRPAVTGRFGRGELDELEELDALSDPAELEALEAADRAYHRTKADRRRADDGIDY
jgi:hypothetical protein